MLGNRLLAQGLITRAQLDAARQRQKDLGGRLGTCLLEIGAVSEHLLLRTLSEQAGVPNVAVRDLQEIAPEVLDLLPASQAIQYRAVPFRKVGNRVDLAVESATDLQAQDEISFLLGSRITVHIANEARVAEVLASAYGHHCSARMTQLLSRLNRSRPSQETTRQRTGAGLRSEPLLEIPHRPSGMRRPLTAASPAGTPSTTTGIAARAEIPQAVGAERTEAPTGSTIGGAAAATAAPLPLTDAAEAGDPFDEALTRARSADELGEATLAELSTTFDRVTLLRLSGGAICGWMARGDRLDIERLRSYACPLAIPSVFLTLQQSGGFFLGKLPPLPAHRRLASFLDAPRRIEFLVMPVRVNDRLVCALLADRPEPGFKPADVDVMRRVAAKLEIALQIIIMQAKLRNV